MSSQKRTITKLVSFERVLSVSKCVTRKAVHLEHCDLNIVFRSTSLKPRFPMVYLPAVEIRACALASILRSWALRGINREQTDAVQQLFESNSWPWNLEAADVCETESTALPTSLCIRIVLG